MQQLSDKMIAGWNATRAQVTDEIEMALVESPNTSADSADNYRGAAVNDDNDKDASVEGDDDVVHEDQHNDDDDNYCPSVDRPDPHE